MDGLVPLPKQQARLRLVKEFLSNPDQQTQLKVSVLSLRLTNLMLDITAKKHKKEDDVPSLVRISKANVQRAAGRLLADIIGAFPHDPMLNTVLAIHSLLTTMLHLGGRCSQYVRYPYLLWRLTTKYNSAEHLQACVAFLDTDPAQLDPGSCGGGMLQC